VKKLKILLFFKCRFNDSLVTMAEQITNTCRRIRFDPQVEVSGVSALMKSGQPFKAVSKTDYFVSRKQCETLTSLNIPYTKL